jgi:hypothetical protein
VISNEEKIVAYEVERSTDNSKFEPIAIIAAKGNNNSTTTYNYTDLNASFFASTVYYRVKVLDQTGSVKYTEVIKILFVKPDVSVTIFPNPAGDKATVLFNSSTDETAQLRIVDNTGRSVYQQNITVMKGKNNFDLMVNKLSTGLYFIDIAGKTINAKIKLIKK